MAVDDPKRDGPRSGVSRSNVEPTGQVEIQKFQGHRCNLQLQRLANLVSWVYPWMMFQKQVTPSSRVREETEWSRAKANNKSSKMRNSRPEVLSKQKTIKKKLSRELGRLVRRSGLRGCQGQAGHTVSGVADAWRALQRVGLRDRFRSGGGGVRASPCRDLGPSGQRHGELELVRAVVFESHWSA